MVKEIRLQNGMVALVDDEDYERVCNYVWYVHVSGGKTRMTVRAHTGKDDDIRLGRFITQCEKDDVVTFKDDNPLNCTRENLLIVTQKEVAYRNKGKRNASSKYKGVSWDKQTSKWRAGIKINGKHKTLGRFLNEEDAAATYNKAALEHFGEYAYQNIIGEDNSAETVNLEKQRQNRSKSKINFRGVRANGKKWNSQISMNGKMMYLGSFDTPEEAAKVYDKKAKELFGDKAILNFARNQVNNGEGHE